MIISGKYEVPESCPNDCPFYRDFQEWGQQSICIRCPVLACKPIPYPDGEGTFSLIEPGGYREDWAKEWQEFFKDYSKEPQLRLKNG